MNQNLNKQTLSKQQAIDIF